MSSINQADFLKQGDDVKRYKEICSMDVPLNSPGLSEVSFQDFLGYLLPRVELQLALMFTVAQALHALFKRFSFPRNFSEILSGIILGKTLLGHLVGFDKHRLLFPDDDIILDTLIKLAFIFYMFLVGVKMDPSMVTKAGRKGWSIGLVAAVGPLILGSFIGSDKMLEYYLPIYRRPAVRAVIRIITLSPFPVIVALLIDLKIMNSELGRLALAAGLIVDMFYVCQNAVSTTFRIYTSDYGAPVISLTLIESIMIMVASVGCRLLFLKIIQWTPEGKPVKNYYISLICCGVIVGALACDNVGLPFNFAPFVIGLAVPSGPPLGSGIADRMDTFISGLLGPFILTYSATKMDLAVFFDFSFMYTILFVLGSITVGKLVFVFGTAMLNKMPVRDAVNLSIIMATQGLVQGALYESVYKLQSIDNETFTVVLLSILVMALAAHLSVGILYDYSRAYSGYQKRNVQHTPYNAELRVLACADRQDDAIAAVKLLEISSPTKESPIAIYALHLVELVGRATPVLINHGLGQKNAATTSRSHHLIDLFEKFGQQNIGVANVQVFTAMSLPKFMHHDICSLAFDKLVSLIIIPFHRKWSPQGKIVYDSNVQRTINRQVLEMSPCSVGILIDRRKIRVHESSMENEKDSLYHICVIFLGGADDREALAYAKRMMVNSLGTCLTVIRIVTGNAGQENQWDTILDTETLRDIKMQGAHQRNIEYREEKSKDGPETAMLINSMLENGDLDMIMVGRTHNENSPLLTGLTEWCDLPELGAIGDILAAADVSRPISVLVMQQQIVAKK
ncbi:hypothetical protein DCAR_0831049 [Daucus carota subsp. sativus]|uniref:Uncharacterized protein n=1 Tax=Daucus carota subsp. sativus TaxID=79200 RepID=A0A175YM39_DAUCS|nr:PREDICTED: cation/H(+) antiporter 3-like [Daucus carota subsp. sativus]WOH11560.1 hypothetical protein DCAR_0831049 [Daucus carota subsp. sativus]